MQLADIGLAVRWSLAKYWVAELHYRVWVARSESACLLPPASLHHSKLRNQIRIRKAESPQSIILNTLNKKTSPPDQQKPLDRQQRAHSLHTSPLSTHCPSVEHVACNLACAKFSHKPSITSPPSFAFLYLSGYSLFQTPPFLHLLLFRIARQSAFSNFLPAGALYYFCTLRIFVLFAYLIHACS